MTVLIALLLMPLSILTLCFVVEVFAGLRPLAVMDIPAAPRARAVIIVPAHDEEAILHDRLTALKAAGGHEAKLLVIADNCSDSTAAIARRLGVDVLERHDPLLRGKDSLWISRAKACNAARPYRPDRGCRLLHGSCKHRAIDCCMRGHWKALPGEECTTAEPAQLSGGAALHVRLLRQERHPSARSPKARRARAIAGTGMPRGRSFRRWTLRPMKSSRI